MEWMILFLLIIATIQRVMDFDHVRKFQLTFRAKPKIVVIILTKKGSCCYHDLFFCFLVKRACCCHCEFNIHYFS